VRDAHLTVVETLAAPDVERLSLADIEFHRLIARASGYEIFVVLLDAVTPTLLTLRRTNLVTERGREEAIEAHKRILDAVTEQDPAGAATAMEDHLAAVLTRWTARQTAEQSAWTRHRATTRFGLQLTRPNRRELTAATRSLQVLGPTAPSGRSLPPER
jgi:DNA-binding GntR family transcriptional regulator